MDSATAELLKQGLLGVLLVASWIVVFFLWRENKAERVLAATTAKTYAERETALQAQRVVDAQSVTTQLLKINEVCVAALTNSSASMEAIQESMTELKQAFRDLENEVRARTIRPGR